MDNLLNQKFVRYLKSVGRVVKILGDGNCLYACFAYHIHNNPKRQLDIRTVIARELLKKKEDYQEWLEEDQVVPKAIKILTLEPPEWGEEIDIRVAADFYKVNVTVLQPNGGFPKYPPGQPHKITLYFIYDNNHYNILLPFNEEFKADNWEDDDDVEMEHSFESEESENECADGASLIERPGYQFLANKVYARGRNDLEVIFLIPRELDKGNLVDSVHQAGAESTLFYYFDYRGRDRWRFQNDEDVSKMFSLYCCKIQMDWTVRNRKLWLSRYLIPHLIMSAIGYTFCGVKLQMLAKSGEGALTTEILNCYWKRQRSTFVDNFEAILERPQLLFCNKCFPECPHRQYFWHIDLSSFVKIIPALFPTGSNILSSLLLFENYERVDSVVLGDLQELHWQNCFPSKASINLAVGILDKNVEKAERNCYCSYLLLLLDGPAMVNQDAELDFITLAENDNIYKSVYAGCCKNEVFRSSHLFHDNSPIRSLLSANSRLFLLRSQAYLCKREARKDESIVIAILQMHLQNRRNRGENGPFLLLNVRSENQYLMENYRTEQKFIMDFVTSDTPIFSFSPDQVPENPCKNAVSRFSPNLFSGNYAVGLANQITLPPGSFQLVTYDDNASAYELIKLHNEGFTSTILKRLYAESIDP